MLRRACLAASWPTLAPRHRCALTFHPFALQTAAWLQNRLPRSTRNWQSPFHLLSRALPSVENVYAFGCLCAAVIPVPRRDGDRHFADRGGMGLYLGPSEVSPGHVVYLFAQPRSSRSSPRFAFGKISFLDSRGIDTPGFPAANLSRLTAASPILPPLRPCAPAPPMPSPKDPRAAMIAMSAPRPSLLAVTPPLSPLRRLRRIVSHLAHLPLPVQEGLRHPPSRSPSMFPAPHHVLPNRSPCRISSRGSLCAAPHASGSSVTLLAHFSVAPLFLLRAFPSTWLLPSSPMPSTANHVPPIS